MIIVGWLIYYGWDVGDFNWGIGLEPWLDRIIQGGWLHLSSLACLACSNWCSGCSSIVYRLDCRVRGASDSSSIICPQYRMESRGLASSSILYHTFSKASEVFTSSNIIRLSQDSQIDSGIKTSSNSCHSYYIRYLIWNLIVTFMKIII